MMMQVRKIGSRGIAGVKQTCKAHRSQEGTTHRAVPSVGAISAVATS